MMTGMAHLGHLVIYLLFIVLPVIGLVMMYNRGNPWVAFGITMPHAAEANFERVDMLKSGTSRWRIWAILLLDFMPSLL